MKYYTQFWKRAFDFKGVASRPQYWFAVLLNIAVVFVVGLILMFIDEEGGAMSIFQAIYSLAMIVPSISVTVRRLHDINKSGWLYLIGFIPFVGSIILFVFTLFGTVRENNRWRMYDIQRGYINEEIFKEPLADQGRWVYKDYEYEEK